MTYVSILWGSVGTGVGFFSVYLAYLVIVKGRLRGANITRELYSAVGAFAAFIVMMSLLTPLLSNLPSLATSHHQEAKYWLSMILQPQY